MAVGKGVGVAVGVGLGAGVAVGAALGSAPGSAPARQSAWVWTISCVPCQATLLGDCPLNERHRSNAAWA